MLPNWPSIKTTSQKARPSTRPSTTPPAQPPFCSLYPLAISAAAVAVVALARPRPAPVDRRLRSDNSRSTRRSTAPSSSQASSPRLLSSCSGRLSPRSFSSTEPGPPTYRRVRNVAPATPTSPAINSRGTRRLSCSRDACETPGLASIPVRREGRGPAQRPVPEASSLRGRSATVSRPVVLSPVGTKPIFPVSKGTR